MRAVLDWIDARTGFRAARRVVLDEPLPPGTGWLFTLGSVLLALLAIQLLTGAFLTLYYAPTPDHAYDSVRFISSTTAGRLVRGLHHYGASFIVVVLVLHMLRVILFGSYKPPREVTWLSGLALLALILAFALTGYLLPWDQRAYWATVVTINISRLTPGAGEVVAGVLRGGADIGALTLTRWYAAHVIFLPGLLVVLVAAHLVLMRRHGISGPLRARAGVPYPFYPTQAARDVVIVTLVIVGLAALAWRGMPPLEGRADPTETSYVPRPEWYFLGLFQLLKYFPGRWEVVGAIVVPGLVAAFLALLPWIDRGPHRRPGRRRAVMTIVVAGCLGVVALTALGWRDRPVNATLQEGWGVRAVGGRMMAANAGCTKCHEAAGRADPLERITVTRGKDWLSGHIVDPEMIAPGLREPPRTLNERQVTAIVAYVNRLSQQAYPGFSPEVETASAIFARWCIGCHRLDGDGGTDGPDLTKAGSKHDAAALRTWIADPEAVDPEADMPAFADRLTSEQLDIIARYLAARK